METSAPILHDAILLAVGIAAVYLVVAVMQLLQLKSLRRQPRPNAQEPSLGFVAADAESAEEGLATQLQEGRAELLKCLQDDVERLKTELQLLREEMRQRERNAPSSVSQKLSPASPKYNEAMRYAQHGMSAVGIAQKCAISLGEAQLIVSLSRDPQAGRLDDGNRAAA